MEIVEMIAMVCHEANRAYCKAIGDDSQPAWDDAPEWQKESAIKGVSFRYSNPTATPENMHESWLEEKRNTGWKYGAVKNPEMKEHPCFIPYSDLPADQKIKDRLFSSVFDALMHG